jgi:hypothetical protein
VTQLHLNPVIQGPSLQACNVMRCLLLPICARIPAAQSSSFVADDDANAGLGAAI